MFCSRCGNGLKEDSNFCPKCGLKIATQDKSVQEVKKKETLVNSQNGEDTLKLVEVEERIEKCDGLCQMWETSNNKKQKGIVESIVLIVCMLLIISIGFRDSKSKYTNLQKEEKNRLVSGYLSKAENEISDYNYNNEKEILLATLEEYLIPLYGVAAKSELEIVCYYDEERASALASVVGIHDVFLGDYNHDGKLEMLVVVAVGNDVWNSGVTFETLYYFVDDSSDWKDIKENGYTYGNAYNKYNVFLYNDRAVCEITMDYDAYIGSVYDSSVEFTKDFFINKVEGKEYINSIYSDNEYMIYRVFDNVVVDKINEKEVCAIQNKICFSLLERKFEDSQYNLIHYFMHDNEEESYVTYLGYGFDTEEPLYSYPNQYEEGKNAFFQEMRTYNLGVYADVNFYLNLYSIDVKRVDRGDRVTAVMNYQSYNPHNYLNDICYDKTHDTMEVESVNADINSVEIQNYYKSFAEYAYTTGLSSFINTDDLSEENALKLFLILDAVGDSTDRQIHFDEQTGLCQVTADAVEKMIRERTDFVGRDDGGCMNWETTYNEYNRIVYDQMIEVFFYLPDGEYFSWIEDEINKIETMQISSGYICVDVWWESGYYQQFLYSDKDPRKINSYSSGRM